MTDIAVAEAPAEFSPDLGKTTPEVVLEGEASLPPEADVRALPELDHPIGPLRQAVLDHLLDSEGPQTVAQILAALPAGTSRNTAESAIKRNFDAGLIERADKGVYKLAPPKSAGPPRAAPPPEPDQVGSDGMTNPAWFDALERWFVDPSTWDAEKLGPSPDQPDNRIPSDIRLRFADRLRKREERRRDREAAAARQAEADAELRAKLIEAAGGNVQHGSGVDDVGAIRRAMEFGVAIADIRLAVRCVHNPQSCPTNGAAITWRSPALLKKIAELHCKFTIIPSMIAAMEAAGKPASASELSPAVQAPPEQFESQTSRS